MAYPSFVETGDFVIVRIRRLLLNPSPTFGYSSMMTKFRFIHSSDLHLGRRFGNLPEDARGRLVEARHAAIGRLANAARTHTAAHILIAGDLFDTETPSDPVWRQALAAMAAEKGIEWWIIPGNHDSLVAESLWDRFRAQAPDSIHFIDRAEPVEIAPQVNLLPAPVTSKFPGRDLTEWMTACATPDSHLRIGLAHGGVQTFGSEDDVSEIIPPDRSISAGLDYLALGDWHGYVSLGDRAFYSGTPELDRFKHSGRGVCLAVSIDEIGAVPKVEKIETGQFDWSDITLSLTPEQDPLDVLGELLPSAGPSRRNRLIHLHASGWIRLPERRELVLAVETVAPEFCHLEFEEAGLGTEHTAGDLDEISTGGALRMAAEALHTSAEDAALSTEERAIAGRALNRLYSYVKDAAE